MVFWQIIVLWQERVLWQKIVLWQKKIWWQKIVLWQIIVLWRTVVNKWWSGASSRKGQNWINSRAGQASKAGGGRPQTAIVSCAGFHRWELFGAPNCWVAQDASSTDPRLFRCSDARPESAVALRPLGWHGLRGRGWLGERSKICGQVMAMVGSESGVMMMRRTRGLDMICSFICLALCAPIADCLRCSWHAKYWPPSSPGLKMVFLSLDKNISKTCHLLLHVKELWNKIHMCILLTVQFDTLTSCWFLFGFEQSKKVTFENCLVKNRSALKDSKINPSNIFLDATVSMGWKCHNHQHHHHCLHHHHYDHHHHHYHHHHQQHHCIRPTNSIGWNWVPGEFGPLFRLRALRSIVCCAPQSPLNAVSNIFLLLGSLILAELVVYLCSL